MKPVVHYHKDAFVQIPTLVGGCAMISPIDHPSVLVSNKCSVITSPVVAFGDNAGEFETENTKYIPV